MKPISTINSVFANVPSELQKEALEVMIDECKRIESGEYTKEEIEFLRLSRQLGESSSKTFDKICSQIFGQ